IVGADHRRASLGWLVGHAVLLTIAPALVTAASLLSVAAPRLIRKIDVAQFLVALPLVEVVPAALLPLLAVWLVLALFYATTAPGRLPSRSAVFGAAAAALALAILLAAFGWLQVGASRASVVDASVAAVPVFMLWVYFSWLVVLLGAELAVGHATDRLLPGGVRAWRLDADCTRLLGVLIAARAAREGAGARSGTEWITTELPQQTGLPPAAVFEVGRLLLRRGLVRETEDGYVLAPEAETMRPADVEAAIDHDPALADVRRELDRALGHELAELHELHALNLLDARRA
ncbi:MAG TPA: YhjD/YihY/BrkB family envelope integrity protein, partial [Polyangia bacterium]|nr:YhjD/YihY/BrkB family envelope integrity protein [Polyangia bacterium]